VADGREILRAQLGQLAGKGGFDRLQGRMQPCPDRSGPGRSDADPQRRTRSI
jgi:hypothetical protein